MIDNGEFVKRISDNLENSSSSIQMGKIIPKRVAIKFENIFTWLEIVNTKHLTREERNHA